MDTGGVFWKMIAMFENVRIFILWFLKVYCLVRGKLPSIGEGSKQPVVIEEVWVDSASVVGEDGVAW